MTRASPVRALTMVRQLKADLLSFVQDSVAQNVIATGARPARSAARTVSLSPVLPVLKAKTYTQVLHQIDQASGTFAKTHNANAFAASLVRISRQIPYGGSQLLPIWQSDAAIYDPSVPGSGTTMVRQIKADLVSYVQASVTEGSFVVRRATRTFPDRDSSAPGCLAQARRSGAGVSFLSRENDLQPFTRKIMLNQLARLSVVLVALLHFGFMVLEATQWNTPLGRKLTGLGEASARETVGVGINMAIYNGFLGVALLWAGFASRGGQANSMLMLLLGFIVIAGVVGTLTMKNPGIVVFQSLPAILALSLTWINRS